MKRSTSNQRKDARKPRKQPPGRIDRVNRNEPMMMIPRGHYLSLLKLRDLVIEFLKQRTDPKLVEQKRIEQETIERGNHQLGVGWTYRDHFVPVVSEEWNRKYQRRKEIIRKGTWNPSRKGWEYDGDFAGI
jgi:hypothetical protein